MDGLPGITVAVRQSAETPRHVCLINGSGFTFRAYHALAPLKHSDGTPTNAVLGFSNMLAALLSESNADHVAVMFDATGTSSSDPIYDDCQVNHGTPPNDLVTQVALAQQVTEGFGVCWIEMDDFEADDLIATFARHAVHAGARVTIVSSDKHMMQLVGRNVTMFDPITNRRIGETEVRERFGVGPAKVTDVLALCGDCVDQVPGVPGIGIKTAAELINTYGDLETLLATSGLMRSFDSGYGRLDCHQHQRPRPRQPVRLGMRLSAPPMPDIPVPILTLIGPISARAVSIRGRGSRVSIRGRGSRVSIRGSRYSCANRCCSEAKADCCPGAYAAMVTVMAVMAMSPVMATSVPIMLSGGGKRGCYDECRRKR